jgi:CheY-like chemotaxis protein
MPTPPISKASQKTVLVLEDEPALQEAIKLKLQQSGVHVLTASNGEDALEILKQTKPNLAWFDILLPGMNGLEVLRQVRGDERLKNLPVVMVSVSGGPEKIKQAFGLNVVDYIIKSEYPIDDIIRKINGILKTLQ